MAQHGGFGGGQGGFGVGGGFGGGSGGGGDTLGDFFRNKQIDLSNQLLDPTSQLYQGIRSFAGQAFGSPGTGTLLSLLQAGGGNFGASQVQAQQSQRAGQGRKNDALNLFLKQLFQSNLGLGAGLIGQAQDSDLRQQGIAEQVRSNRASEGGFLDFLGDFGGIAAGIALAPVTGGASLAIPLAQQAQQQFSDIRLKEKIDRVGGSESGINIYEFNFKGNSQRYRGVIAQEVPEVTQEINGFKYVDYSQIDVDFEVI